jgi:hypothetical protein
MMTRPDISFSARQICKFMHVPRTVQLDVINRILRFLKGSPGNGVWMKCNYSNEVCDYSDAYWVESFDRKSTTSFRTFVSENLTT